eukprot:scaffold9809_cov60-Phaeocystis_antarctica.AAC.2
MNASGRGGTPAGLHQAIQPRLAQLNNRLRLGVHAVHHPLVTVLKQREALRSRRDGVRLEKG